MKTTCESCKGTGKVIRFYSRGPTSPPGNGYVGCPSCPDGERYSRALAAETEDNLLRQKLRPSGRSSPAIGERKTETGGTALDRGVSTSGFFSDMLAANHGPASACPLSVETGAVMEVGHSFGDANRRERVALRNGIKAAPAAEKTDAA